MRSVRFGAVLAILAIALLTTQLRATNHLVHIHEVMAGANGNSKIQFIVIEQEAFGQNQWGPTNGLQSAAMLVFFDATGRETGKFKFPGFPSTGGSLKTLIATQEFANLPGAPAPNIIIPPLLNAINGKVCFKGNPANPFAFPRNDCLSYGAFTGDTEGFGPPTSALPIMNTVSLLRTVHNNLNSGFTLDTTPTPINIGFATLAMTPASQVVQGENLFNNETFLGNGRTCASCHVADLSLRFTPDNAQARFATLTDTFDPQFVGETAPSSFDAGFDFNLNTLTLTAAVATNQPCTGELRGIITFSGGARGKVLTRVSATQYLVYGGKNAQLTETVTDGTCSATVSTVVSGSLGAIVGSGVDGLENPLRMRRSNSVDFPNGRALILENIDAFPPTAPVFRKSPHLLNLSRTAPFGFGGNVPDLQQFSQDAVRQHFPRTLARLDTGSNPDFRVPTADERAAMEAFMLAQEFPPGSDPNKFNLDLFALTPQQQAGRTAFFGSVAKCSQCHGGPVLAQTTVDILGKGIGVNASFNTGVVNQLINAPFVDNLPCEPSAGFGVCGSREFSTPQLFNVKNLSPFFHDASAPTLDKAVEFYTSTAFNNSPAGVAIGGITMTAGMIADITAFLEGIGPNATPTISNSLDTSTNEDVAHMVSFTVGDDGGAATVMLSGTSSNTTLLPNSNLVFGGSGESRTVTITPAANQFGMTTITLTASDGALMSSDTFVLTVSAVNDPPTISPIGNLTVDEDSGTSALAFTVGDVETAASALVVSSGTTNAPLHSTNLTGTDASRSVSITPSMNQFGTATVTVTVSDGGLMASRDFLLTVNNVNDPPTISTIPSAMTKTSMPIGPIAVTVGDLDNPAADLTLSAVSSNPALVPNANVVFGGSGENRTATITPAMGQKGETTITLTVSDGGLMANAQLTLMVSREPSDMDADGRGDVFWRNKVSGQNIIWLMNGPVIKLAAFAVTIADTNWEIKGVGDFNNDRRGDVLWRNRVTGQNIIWLMDGITVTFAVFGPTIANLDWEVRGTGDFDGNGKDDVFWRNKTTGQNIVWLMDGTTVAFSAFIVTIADTNWEVKGIGDTNGDGKADILWRNKGTGQNIGWLMDGITVTFANFLPTIADTNWEIMGLGDLDGDGKSDVLWRNKSSGQNIVWLMNGTAITLAQFIVTIADTNWEVKGLGDINLDGRTDVFWRNKATGQNIGWLMNGTTVSIAQFLPTIADTNWEIVGKQQ